MTDLRTACGCVAMALAITALAHEATAQPTGDLLVIMRLGDPQTRDAFPMPSHVLLVTAEDSPSTVRRLVIRAQVVELPLPPGTYRLESEQPLTFRGREYRWSHRVLIAEAMRTTVELNDGNDTTKPSASIALPQPPPPPPPPTRAGPRRYDVFGPFVQYGSPQRLTGGVSWLIPIGEVAMSDGFAIKGVELQASAGSGGWRGAGGPFFAGLPYFAADVMFTLTHTTSAPRGATGNATYIGVEPGTTIFPLWSVGRSIIMFRSSIGVARRLDGAGDGKRTIFTWSTGAQVFVFLWA